VTDHTPRLWRAILKPRIPNRNRFQARLGRRRFSITFLICSVHFHLSGDAFLAEFLPSQLPHFSQLG